jgi:DNA-binding response OmpR family regulator
MPEIKVLVVDDEKELLDLMVRRLVRLGYEPDTAGDGRAASALIERTEYDLIVTDIYMPGVTGLGLLRHAKERDPHVQVVVVTGSATLENAIEALNEGAFAYLQKPFDHLSVFDNLVSRALDYRRLAMDNLRMAEIQRRRGDMLEDEVTQRLSQLRQRQKELLDLLGSLPDGVVVVEEGGRVVLSSPVAEKWLARELRSGEQHIQRFIEKVHDEWAEECVEIEIGAHALVLTAVELPSATEKKRKVVIIREVKKSSPDFHPQLAEPLETLKKGLAWLYQQRMDHGATELLIYLAKQVSDMEALIGRSLGSDDRAGTEPTDDHGAAVSALPVGAMGQAVEAQYAEEISSGQEADELSMDQQSSGPTEAEIHEAEPLTDEIISAPPEQEAASEWPTTPKRKMLRSLHRPTQPLDQTEEAGAADRDQGEGAPESKDEQAFDALIEMLDEDADESPLDVSIFEDGDDSHLNRLAEVTQPHSTSGQTPWPPQPPSENDEDEG